MQRSTLKLSLIIFSSLFLFGCQLADKITSDAPPVGDISVKALESQNKQIDRAVAMLEKGQAQQAELLIDEVLILNPKHENANFLKTQLDSSYKQIFKTDKTFNYKVKSGDSLGKLANYWLGNSLYFVSLSKMNNVKNPSRLSPGTILKIPQTKISQVIFKQRRRSTANLKLLKQYRPKGQILRGLTKANSLFMLDKDLTGVYHEQQLLLDDYAKRSKKIVDKQAMIRNVKELSESARNKKQKAIYERFIKAQNRVLVLAESQELFKSQEFLKAAEKLVEAKKLDANVTRQTNVFRMETLLVNKLHEQAIVFYRNHSLDKALGRWKLILQLNPNHSLATKYKTRTEKLIQKLDSY